MSAPPVRIRPPASELEAAAIVAAIERFQRDTADAPQSPAAPRESPWLRAARLEAVGLDADAAPIS